MLRDLRPEFEQQLELVISEAGNFAIGDLEMTPAAVLAADSVAYEAQFASWFYEVWVALRAERLEAILALHGNEKRYQDLCEAVSNSQVVPFIGSGMSAASGIPTWAEFLRSIRKYSTLSESDLEGLLSSSSFEEAAAQLSKSMPDKLFNERIAHDLRPVSVAAIRGPVLCLPLLFSEIVLTSNLDQILETVYQAADKTFGHILLGPDIQRLALLRAPTESFLLKLHGDCEDSENRVLTPEEYEVAYADGPVIEELAQIFKTNHVLFLGCSIQSDRSVDLVARVATRDTSMPKHYAFLQEPASDDLHLEREHFLTERGVFPIWYSDDHDESIEALLVGVLNHLGRLDELRGGQPESLD
jgi:hypothetical protein